MKVPVVPRVLARSTPCVFGTSIFDTLFPKHPQDNEGISDSISSGHRDHYDRSLVSMTESSSTNGGESILSLDAPLSTLYDDHTSAHFPLGRARECPEMMSAACPTTVLPASQQTTTIASAQSSSLHHPHVKLAVVGLVLDPSQQHILLTRRPTYMRSFPGAWVLPGGSVDSKESLTNAVAREVWEETGLETEPASWHLSSLWESVYPTTSQPEVPTRAHHLVVYLSTVLVVPDSDPHHHDHMLRLCPVEVDGASWLSRSNVQSLVKNSRYLPPEDRMETEDTEVRLITSDGSSNDNMASSILLQEMTGIYPQKKMSDNDNEVASSSSSSRLVGIAQGSLFALEEFMSKDCWMDNR